MRKAMKSMLCVLSASICIIGSAITANAADYIDFDVTYPNDPYSYSMRKMDDEQNFYMTGTYFSKSGRLSGSSIQVGDKSVISYIATITPSSPRASKGYSKTAKRGFEYELHTFSNVNGINVRGRYTP